MVIFHQVMLSTTMETHRIMLNYQRVCLVHQPLPDLPRGHGGPSQGADGGAGMGPGGGHSGGGTTVDGEAVDPILGAATGGCWALPWGISMDWEVLGYLHLYPYIIIYIYIHLYIHTHAHVYIYIYMYIHC